MKRKEEYLMQNLGGEYILVPLGAEVVNLNGIIVLNNTGRFIWEQLAKDRSAEELVTAVRERFDADTERANADVKAFLDDITHRGLVIV